VQDVVGFILLGVHDLEHALRCTQDATVADLATALGVERRGLQDDTAALALA